MGGTVALPTYIKAKNSDPLPKSMDGRFDEWVNESIAPADVTPSKTDITQNKAKINA